MKVRSIRSNFLLNAFRVASSTLIGVFTMPYINKVLGPESLGKVEYINAIVNYFIMFSALGIPMYAIKQVAKVRDNIEELSRNTIEILGVLLINTLLSYVILFVIFSAYSSLWDYKDLIILMSSMILLTNIGAEWFFQGIEDQMYITVRYVIIRIITLVVLFTLVRSSEDYIYYALIVVLNVCGSNFFNILRLFKIIDIKAIQFRHLNFIRHIKPSLTIFLAAASINIYAQIDTVFLGAFAGDEYVGYYAVANKLIRYVILFITIIGSVMLPRLSNLWISDRDAYYKYLQLTLNIILCLALPFFGYFALFSKLIIDFMAGESFLPAVVTMQILSPLCLIVGIAYFLGFLVLYPQDKERFYTIAVSTSAVISIGLNYFLITRYQQNGAAVTQLFSEFVAIAMMLFFMRKSLPQFNVSVINVSKMIVAGVIIFCICMLLNGVIDFSIYSSTYVLMIGSSVYFLLYFLILLALGESTVKNYFGVIIKFIK